MVRKRTRGARGDGKRLGRLGVLEQCHQEQAQGGAVGCFESHGGRNNIIIAIEAFLCSLVRRVCVASHSYGNPAVIQSQSFVKQSGSHTPYVVLYSTTRSGFGNFRG